GLAPFDSNRREHAEPAFIGDAVGLAVDEPLQLVKRDRIAAGQHVDRNARQNRASRRRAQSIPLDCLAKFTNSSDTPRNAPSRRIEFSFSRVEMLSWFSPATAFSICSSIRSSIASSRDRKSAKSAASGYCER